MMRPSIYFMIFTAILLTTNYAGSAERQQLRATPGLWKITYRTRINGQPDPVILKWRCVSEEQMDDPATAFARPAVIHGSCKLAHYAQTDTTVNWQYHCESGSAVLDSTGAIKFDTRLHYTGDVKINGVVMGYPVENVVAVEGVHRAACTSPED